MLATIAVVATVFQVPEKAGGCSELLPPPAWAALPQPCTSGERAPGAPTAPSGFLSPAVASPSVTSGATNVKGQHGMTFIPKTTSFFLLMLRGFSSVTYSEELAGARARGGGRPGHALARAARPLSATRRLVAQADFAHRASS